MMVNPFLHQKNERNFTPCLAHCEVGYLGMGIKKARRCEPNFVNLKSNTMKNTMQK